jgi:fructokinase
LKWIILNMTAPQVLCIGELLFDYLANQSGRSLTEVESWTPYPGGAPANVATALTKLGTPSAYIGCLGQDPDGETLFDLLKSLDVNLDGLQRHPQAPTRRVYVTRSLEGDRTFAGFGDVDTTAFADAFLDAAYLPEALFERAQFLVLGTLGLAYPGSRAAMMRSLELAHQYQVTRFVDVNWRPVFWPEPEAAFPLIATMLTQADFIKLSDEEASLFFNSTDPQAVVAQYPQVKGAIVTAGEQGCRYCFGNVAGELPAFAVDVIDTTGAGDSFVAGFLHQLCAQPNLDLTDPNTVRQVIRYASAVGALTTTKPGAIAAQPTPASLDLFLAKH